MTLKFLVLWFLFTSTIHGSDLGYMFSDQANGWLKLLRMPIAWEDAMVYCDCEGSVLASPLGVQLSEAIKKHVSRVDGTVSTIYTGVHAEYTDGDFLSIEGVPMWSMPVPLLPSENIEYTSSEGCIVWDTSYNNLRKVKCDSEFPYVCYKKIKTAPIPEDNGLESDSGKLPLPSDSRPPDQPTQENLPSQPSQPTTQPSQWTPPEQRYPSAQQLQPPYTTPPDQRTQPNQPTQPSHLKQPDQQTETNHWTSTSQWTQPDQRTESNQTVIFTDTAKIEFSDGSSSRVVVQNKQNQYLGGSSTELDETTMTTIYDNNEIPSQFHEGTQSDVTTSAQRYSAKSQKFSTRTSSYGVVTIPHPQPQAVFISRRREQLSYSFDTQTGWGFKMHQPDTWKAALRRCAAEGAVLASPLTTQLNDAIKAFVSRVNPSVTSIYTGIYANFSIGDFYSTEGVSLSRMPVSLDSSANVVYNSSESCIVMNTFNTVVTSVRGTERYPYVCLKKSTVVRGCGLRIPVYTYEPRTESCYKFHNQAQNWTSAYNTCRKEGGHLAIINSQRESVALKELFANNPGATILSHYPDSAYIGIRDWLDGNSWLTVKGESLPKSGYIGWAKTQPNNANGNENCGTLNRNGFIYDDPCDLNLAFICEKDSEILDSSPGFVNT